ncbi:glutathione peroxidase [Pseudonocardia sp. TMWB2A]|uniref:glutathione peroxidase n=1 Tax=Pseudonocardia sp. TMWB2A TaxID=687430 RepID=UPI00307D3B07
MTSLYNFTAKAADGNPLPLSDYRGKVLLIVNTASKCGFTPQYEGLEELYRKYHEQGFEILAFPCNQFGEQEPGNAEEIANFCSLTYDVTFPVLAKVDVNGKQEDPIWTYLKKQQTGLLGFSGIKWNFTKFLVDREGNIVARHAPTTKPYQLEEEIKALLAR